MIYYDYVDGASGSPVCPSVVITGKWVVKAHISAGFLLMNVFIWLLLDYFSSSLFLLWLLLCVFFLQVFVLFTALQGWDNGIQIF